LSVAFAAKTNVPTPLARPPLTDTVHGPAPEKPSVAVHDAAGTAPSV
jgi:hypothetical protein